MAVKKSAVKQYLKFILQKTLLPLCYNLNRRKPVDKKLVLFADSNSDTPPESMTSLIAELEKRGYRCVFRCCDFKKAGFVEMMKFMCRFMTDYATAGALVICNYFVPAHACNKRPETKVVQLWHSCGALKKFGYSSQSDISSHFKGSVSKNLDLVTVSSPECESVFTEAFRLAPGVAKAVGVCRTDMFFDKEHIESCRRKLYENYPQLCGKKLLIYLPTFRGDASHAYSVGHEEILRLKDDLGGGWFVAVRMHPRVKDGITELDRLSTNELLCCADMLITDYSSALFEYALLGRPMVLWCPDLKEYTAERDFYLDFKTDIPCPVITEGNALKTAVLQEYENFNKESCNAFLKKYMSACDGQSTKRTADFITADGKD
ncbi:MAG: CDP-glycerol glycerophosphotransferase family protein [Oscillospiraceae bacterium]